MSHKVIENATGMNANTQCVYRFAQAEQKVKGKKAIKQ